MRVETYVQCVFTVNKQMSTLYSIYIMARVLNMLPSVDLITRYNKFRNDAIDSAVDAPY